MWRSKGASNGKRLRTQGNTRLVARLGMEITTHVFRANLTAAISVPRHCCFLGVQRCRLPGARTWTAWRCPAADDVHGMGANACVDLGEGAKGPPRYSFGIVGRGDGLDDPGAHNVPVVKTTGDSSKTPPRRATSCSACTSSTTAPTGRWGLSGARAKAGGSPFVLPGGRQAGSLRGAQAACFQDQRRRHEKPE